MIENVLCTYTCIYVVHLVDWQKRPTMLVHATCDVFNGNTTRLKKYPFFFFKISSASIGNVTLSFFTGNW